MNLPPNITELGLALLVLLVLLREVVIPLLHFALRKSPRSNGNGNGHDDMALILLRIEKLMVQSVARTESAERQIARFASEIESEKGTRQRANEAMHRRFDELRGQVKDYIETAKQATINAVENAVGSVRAAVNQMKGG